MTVKDIYDALNSLAPFKIQDKWDNSGLLVGDETKKVTKALLVLDITNEAVGEAKEIGAELIISHHPVIFNPLHCIDSKNPVYKLIENGISAICSHTPMDLASGGINNILFDLLEKELGLVDNREILENISPEKGYGWVCDLKEAIPATVLASKARDILGCSVVRFTDGGMISRLALCSGSGGSMLNEAISKGANGFLTADIKHDVFISAHNMGISLFDCGHFHTENVLMGFLAEELPKAVEEVEFIVGKSSYDVVKYIF